MRKLSLPLPNIANAIRDHIAAAWPELEREPIADLWFTGSHVWRFLYPSLVTRPGDWDMFVVHQSSAELVVSRLGLSLYLACLTRDKVAGVRKIDPGNIPQDREPGVIDPGGYNDGYSYATPRGMVDLWITSVGSALAELRTYPEGSHDHCRAAFSFYDGLIVLPNDRWTGP